MCAGGNPCEHERRAAQLEARVEELAGQVKALLAFIVQLQQRLYGRKSEKRVGSTGAGETAGDAGEGSASPPARKRGQQRDAPGHGRRRRTELPAEVIEHDLPEEDRCCPRCGAPLRPLGGAATSEEIDWEVTVRRKVHHRRRYRRTCQCSDLPQVYTAPPPPKVIPKGLFTVGFIAQMLVEKFLLGRPLNKTIGALAMVGLKVSAGTLVGVMVRVHLLLLPLEEAIRARNREAKHWHADETRWKVFAEVEGKTGFNWWLWVFASVETTVFILDPSRSAQVPKGHLERPEGDRELPSNEPGRPPESRVVSADRYAAYQCLEGFQISFCWAHVRRDFQEAGRGYPEALADWEQAWLDRIGELYRRYRERAQWVEDPFGEPPTRPEFVEADSRLRETVAELACVRDQELAVPELHPAARKVLVSMKNHWEGLTLFLDHLYVPLDNNEAERLLRTPVVGRKNFYGSGSVQSGQLAACLFTILCTALKNGLNPLTYLRAYLQACAEAGGQPPADLERFLPWALSATDRAAWSAPPPPAVAGKPP